MIWDGLILVLIVTLGVAGWKVGLVNSWRGPIAVIVATLVTKLLYVDFATFVVQQLRVDPATAVAIAYVLLWGMFEIILEILLSVLIHLGSKNRPNAFSRAGAAALGVVKGLIAILLPCMALQVPLTVPPPPTEKVSLFVMPLELGTEKSVLVKMFSSAANSMLPACRSFVVSDKQPSFTPNFKLND